MKLLRKSKIEGPKFSSPMRIFRILQSDKNVTQIEPKKNYCISAGIMQQLSLNEKKKINSKISGKDREGLGKTHT